MSPLFAWIRYFLAMFLVLLSFTGTSSPQNTKDMSYVSIFLVFAWSSIMLQTTAKLAVGSVDHRKKSSSALVAFANGPSIHSNIFSNHLVYTMWKYFAFLHEERESRFFANATARTLTTSPTLSMLSNQARMFSDIALRLQMFFRTLARRNLSPLSLTLNQAAHNSIEHTSLSANLAANCQDKICVISEEQKKTVTAPLDISGLIDDFEDDYPDCDDSNDEDINNLIQRMDSLHLRFDTPSSAAAASLDAPKPPMDLKKRYTERLDRAVKKLKRYAAVFSQLALQTRDVAIKAAFSVHDSIEEYQSIKMELPREQPPVQKRLKVVCKQPAVPVATLPCPSDSLQTNNTNGSLACFEPIESPVVVSPVPERVVFRVGRLRDSQRAESPANSATSSASAPKKKLTLLNNGQIIRPINWA